ncbi:MAG: caspase family protein [Fimbriimonadaceae bacterium]|nr:caspase family protein [Fimbriimonadaceae bacterium]
MKFGSYAIAIKRLVAIAALGIISVAAYAETYAFCIGINDYPEVKREDGTPVDNDLKGCVNDAKALKDVFIKKFGVKDKNIKSLYDKEASLEKFLDGIKWLAANAKAGDQVVFVYSGHGAQVKDDKEADGIQEVIVLADMQLIPGNFFGELANLLNVNGVNTTFYFDSCFSGGMSRKVDGAIQERWKTMGTVTPKSAGAMESVRSSLVSVRPKQINRGQAPMGEAAFLFASQETKPSSDVSGMKDIQPHGLFTLLVLAMLEDEPKIAVKDMYDAIDAVLEDINKKIKEQDKNREGFTQGPNFESSKSRASKPILIGA